MDATRGAQLKTFFYKSKSYLELLTNSCERIPLDRVEILANSLFDAWHSNSQVFIFGNGGSAGNAIHLANDFIYGISKMPGSGLRINALTANPSVITCLANDVGYEEIFRYQLAVLANPGDVIIALSGSGNSPNIIKALEYCKQKDLQSFAILGYSGGESLRLAKTAIHINVEDMQIAEDLQIIIGHMIMQYLHSKKDILTS